MVGLLLLAVGAAYNLSQPIVVGHLSSDTQVRFLPLVRWGFYSLDDPTEPGPLASLGLLPQEDEIAAPLDIFASYEIKAYGCFDVYRAIIAVPPPLPFLPVPTARPTAKLPKASVHRRGAGASGSNSP